MGKTTLAYQVAHAMARESRPALIISAERGASESAAFMMSILKESDAPLSTDLPLFFADVPRIDHIGLMTAIRDMPEQPRMILIDGYEEFRFDAVQPPSLSSLPHFLKTLAQCFRAIVVVTCELPCFIEERDDFYPRLDDLNGSDPLRDIADLVLLIYRPSIYEEDTVDVDHGLVIVSVARNRHGPGGGCGLRFEGYPPRFVES
jgi:replicative DNA helicase